MGTRVTHGRRGEHERRVRAVARTDPAQAAQQRGQVGPEHAAVDMAFVDHDVAQPPQEGSPAFVTGQQRVVHEVGVGEDQLGVVADPAALLGGGVAVVGRRTDPGDGHRLHRRELVGGQRLGRGEVERRRAPPGRCVGALDEGRQHRQQVAEALARRGAGGDHDVVPSWARSAAARWWAQREVSPAPAHAAWTLGSTHGGHGASDAERAGTSWTWSSRPSRGPEASEASVARGSNAARPRGAVRLLVDIAATVNRVTDSAGLCPSTQENADD